MAARRLSWADVVALEREIAGEAVKEALGTAEGPPAPPRQASSAGPRYVTQAMPGERFGRLTVLGPGAILRGSHARWRCRCACGSPDREYLGAAIREGYTSSCGCLKRETLARRNEAGAADLQGRLFAGGAVVALRPSEERAPRKSGKTVRLWDCVCMECRSIFRALPGHLLAGRVKSCGCRRRATRERKEAELRARRDRPRGADLTGRRFGHLLVLRRGANDGPGKVRWICACDCGTPEFLARAGLLTNGHQKSCGCLAPKLDDKPGARFGRLTFLRMVGRLYELKCSCGEAVRKDPASIRSGNTKSCGCSRRGRVLGPVTRYAFRGEQRTISELAKLAGVSYVAMHRRIVVMGETVEHAVEAAGQRRRAA